MSFFLFEYSNFVCTNKSYAIFQNETKRRRIENINAFNIFDDDNINLFSSNSNSFHNFFIIHNRTFQNVIFNVNNRFLSRKNDRERVADFKNQISLSSLNMWFSIVYVDANIVEIEFKKVTKRNKFSNTKNKTFKRFRRQPRVKRHFFFFFCCSIFASIETHKKNELQKKKFFSSFELKLCWKTKKKKKFFWTCDASNER